MAMLGIFGTALVNIMLGQQRFYQRNVEQMSVRRELRTAINLLPAELRGLASAGGDVIAFSTTALTFRSTIGVSLVCAKASATSIDVPPLASALATTTSWYSAPAVHDTLYALRNDSSGVKGEYWSAHRITAVASATSYCPASPFVSVAGDAGKLRYRFTVTPALPDSVVVSSPIRFTRTGRYSLAQQASGRWYLARSTYESGAWSVPIPVSGPYMAPTTGAGGLSFALYDSTGAAITSIANAARTARIDVVLRAQGMSGSGRVNGAATTVIDSIALRIAVRNRR